MHQENSIPWNQDFICLQANSMDAAAIAAAIYKKTCRSDFDTPGFFLVDMGAAIDSVAFRQLMVDVKEEMATIHAKKRREDLIYLSAGRFDQQESTKPHLDGGPDECFLMLGYEPSQIDSSFEIADYAKCAFDLDISPKEFMARYNPMFKEGAAILKPYVTQIECFEKNSFQILCINNSSASFSKEKAYWQGVLHTATIPNPDESKRRVINSTMIARAPMGSSDVPSKKELEHFIHTSELKRRGYDKLHLEDDT